MTFKLITFLKRLITPTSSSEQTDVVTCQSGQAFPWPKGLRLEAMEEVTLVLPGGILVANVPIESVIDISDQNARVGFEKSPDGDGFATISIELTPGNSVTLLRSAQAMVFSKTSASTSLKVLKRPDPASLDQSKPYKP